MKKSKKQNKIAKKSKKIKQVKVAELAPVKQSVIEDLDSIQITTPITTDRVDWDVCDEMFSLLSYVFQPDGFEDKNGKFYIDDRLAGQWKTFLSLTGWTEDEFWAEADKRPHEECEQCKAEKKEETIKNKSDKNIN